MDKFEELEKNITIGKNANHNHSIILEADDEDIWFHLEDYPSSHVIVSNKYNNGQLTRSELKFCGRICKTRSKYSQCSKIKVNYTKIKNIKILDVPGSVSISNFKTIKV
jgi:predicted ribosome quality control (RQC) complex YloA/Tae2 family protein